jgi:hypothetical protein
MKNESFKFEISLSVLNHLGRNLYRNFITILGEAISNSWDANANNVWIKIDIDNNLLVIKDDGYGMTADDFKGKFLKVGYSKRKEFGMLSPKKKRPYIGAKGIGKLALLSCADMISVISKTNKTDYVGGLINNSKLTKAIKHDLMPDKYSLEKVDLELFKDYTLNHNHGTIIRFDVLKEDLRNTTPYLKKLIALYFRFSLVDPTFNIIVNDSQVSIEDLKDLATKTQFLWIINKIKDPYIDTLSEIKSKSIKINSDLNICGFIASVEKPKNLKVSGSEEKVGIDLFVNGRLREKDILKHLPDFSTRHIASYLYGQIHYDELDNKGNDRFGTSRESIIPGDEKFKELIENLKNKILNNLSGEWDKLRLEIGEDGDIDIVSKERKARSLFNLSSKYFLGNNSKVDKWVKELGPDADFNIPAYVDCFLSENLIRKYIKDKSIILTPTEDTEVTKWRTAEATHKVSANMNIDIRQNDDDLSFLEMGFLTNLVDPQRGHINCLSTDAKPYRPIRNSLMHTALLTPEAKQRLNSVYDNIKARLHKLL